MRLQIRTACLIVRHNDPKQSPETRPGGREVVRRGGGGEGVVYETSNFCEGRFRV